MATRKKAVKESPEDKIKDLSLYFMQGREVVFEGVNWPYYFSDLERLDDAQKLERLAQAAKLFAKPKASVRSVRIVDEGEDEEGKKKYRQEVAHTDVPLTAVGPDLHLTVPDIYPWDDSERYLINDIVFRVESFTKDQATAWNRWSEEQKLSENFAKQTALRRDIENLRPSDADIESLRKEIPNLVKARDELLKRQKAAYLDLDLDEDAVLRVTGRVKLANTRLKEAQVQLSSLNGKTAAIR